MLKIALIIVLMVWGGSLVLGGMLFIVSCLSKRVRKGFGG
jgi:hypothetical protein